MTQVPSPNTDQERPDESLGLSPLTEETLISWIEEFKSDKISRKIMKINKISMLHHDVLYLMHRLVLFTGGPALEFGAYIGGSTVAMGLAAKQCATTVVTVEPGGSYSTHPHIPSEDIYADLLKNINKYGVENCVKTIRGFSHEKKVMLSAKSMLSPPVKSGGLMGGMQKILSGRKSERYKVFSIDSDGKLQRDFGLCHKLLADDAYLVIDDYISTAEDKNGIIVDWVDAAVEFGLVSPLGVYGWGTWIGQFHGEKWDSWQRSCPSQFLAE